MPDKTRVAEELIRWHFEVEPDLDRVYRVLSEHEDDPDEPIKLLEVNTSTVGTGRLEAFGFAPTFEVPFPTLIAEVTPRDLERMRQTGTLPRGWDLERARVYTRSAA